MLDQGGIRLAEGFFRLSEGVRRLMIKGVSRHDDVYLGVMSAYRTS